RARPRVRRRRRATLLGGHLRGRDAGRAGPLRRGPAVRAVVRRGRPARRPSRDRIPRLRGVAGGSTRAAARAHAARAEASSGPLHRAAGTRMTSGVVLARTGASYRVHTDQGEVTATLRGRLKHKDDDRVVAGTVEDVEVRADLTAPISRGPPRRAVPARAPAAGGRVRRRAQPTAAN